MADYGLSWASVGNAASSAGSWLASNWGTVLQVAGVAAQTTGAINQANAQAQQFEAQAEAIETETQLEKQVTERRNRQIIGRNRAVAANAGVDPFSGSSLENEYSNAFEAGMNEALIQYGGDARKRMAKMGAGYAKGAIPGLVGSGLLQGAGIATNWYNLSKVPKNTSWGGGAGRYNLGVSYPQP